MKIKYFGPKKNFNFPRIYFNMLLEVMVDNIPKEFIVFREKRIENIPHWKISSLSPNFKDKARVK